MKPADLESWVLAAVGAGAVRLRVREAGRFGRPTGVAIMNVELSSEFDADTVFNTLEENRVRRNRASLKFVLEALSSTDEVIQRDGLAFDGAAVDEVEEARVDTDMAAVMRAQSAIVAQQASIIERSFTFTTSNMQHVISKLEAIIVQVSGRLVEADANMTKLVEDTLELAQLKQEREAAIHESEERLAMRKTLVEQGMPLLGTIAAEAMKAGKGAKVAMLLETLKPDQVAMLSNVLTPEQRIALDSIFREAAPTNGVTS